MSGLDQEQARLLQSGGALTRANLRNEPPDADEQADLAGAHGIANGLALSGAIWALAMLLAHHWFQ